MKNKKIKFQELVNQHCPYSLSEQIQILEWIFKTGKGYEVNNGRWVRDGVDKLLYDYSANNYKSYTAIKSRAQIRLMFVNAIVPTTTIQKWRDDFDIKLGASRFLNFKSGNNKYLNFKNRDIFQILDKLEGAKLKKEHFHSDYSNRTEPFILNIKFTISENGCHFFLEFTFKECAGSGWIKEFWKREESVEEFFFESFKTIDSWLIQPCILS